MIYVYIKDNKNKDWLLKLRTHTEYKNLIYDIKNSNMSGNLFMGIETPIDIIASFYDDFITYGHENVLSVKQLPELDRSIK